MSERTYVAPARLWHVLWGEWVVVVAMRERHGQDFLYVVGKRFRGWEYAPHLVPEP